MRLEEIKKLKSFPRKTETIEYKDRAKLILTKSVREYGADGRPKKYRFEATIEFVYPDPKRFPLFSKIQQKKWNGNAFGKWIKNAINLFESANQTMINREPTLFDGE